ncbi:MAG: LCCL domain-containing protein [Desulfuromonadales bacterium]
MKRVYRLVLVLFLLSPAAVETTVFAMQEISWTTQANPMRGRNGQQVAYFCPPGGNISDRLWGSVLYTDDSSICTAALHAGLIDTYNGGDVMIEIRPGAGSYQGSRRNGVTSKSYGSFQGSFVFVTGGQRQRSDAMMDDYNRRDDNHRRPPVPDGPDISVPLPGGLGSLNVPGPDDVGQRHQSPHAAQIEWNTTAGDMRGRNGHRVRYFCPPGGAPGSLWGSGLFTDDSSVCTAAVHEGLISTYDGGEVLIEIRPGAGSYHGSRRNGVTSQSYGAFDGSFVFGR